MTVVGIDTHKDTLAACAVDDAGRALEHRSFANTPAGHAELACWVSNHEAAVVAMEGSELYGRPAAVVPADADVAVVEVPPHMTAAARQRRAHHHGTPPPPRHPPTTAAPPPTTAAPVQVPSTVTWEQLRQSRDDREAGLITEAQYMVIFNRYMCQIGVTARCE